MLILANFALAYILVGLYMTGLQMYFSIKEGIFPKLDMLEIAEGVLAGLFAWPIIIFYYVRRY